MTRVLILKVVRDDMTSHDGFVWPEAGPVTPTTWAADAQCGNGLHGWLRGEGTYRHSYMSGKWIVFSAAPEDVVSLDGGDKVKVRAGEVVYCGDKPGAIAYLKEHGALTAASNPGWCCFTDTQLRELAYRAATRAVKKHAPTRLRARGREDLATTLEALPDITDRASAIRARDAASAYAAADAASYAASYAADAASYDAYAAAAAADAASYAADAYAAAAAAAAASYAAAYAAEREAQRRDRLGLLGLDVP